ncbi:cytochrome c oxidase subunit 3 [Phenylobacterium sp. LjRoot219]|uniref:cytochrome c oxidase subunit 3 n=1 Tax=Phenylobacterium sp. LjRoot219 TaxID=3342283 RepID=UPI003ED0E04F
MTHVADADVRRSVAAEQAGRPALAVPGQPDMWALVLFEALIFSSYFVVYVLHRAADPELYLRSQAHLSQGVGVLNTLILLTSSWSVARCAQRSRQGDYRGALRAVFLTIFIGLVFCGSKLYEWIVKIEQGLTFSTNEFFSFYYFLTGMHLLHVLVGFIVLGVVVYQLWSPARRSQEIIETGTTYWHMVDFLWVIIFALLYVMR